MVLNEVVVSAWALTGARYGAIATIDEAGAPQDFVTSGFTADEHRHIVEWPDVPAYVRALGFSPDDWLPSKTFQGTPMRHGVVARIVTGPHEAHRQDPHRPRRYDTGRPSSVSRLRISQPRTTSLPCPVGLRARRPSPMMDL